MRTIKLLSTAFLMLSLGCSKEVEIEFPVHEPKLVVYSTISPWILPNPKPLNIFVQQTSQLSDTANYPVNDALVVYLKNNIITDTLECSDIPGMYWISKNMADYPEEGNIYSIKILKPGYEPVTASTTIPSKVAILTAKVIPVAYFDEDGLAYSEVSITFEDPANEVNYYELAISNISFKYDNQTDFYKLSTTNQIITSESYYPSLLRFDLKKPEYLLFNDKKINNSRYTLSVSYMAPQTVSEKRTISAHYITVHLRNVTEEYYRFKTTMIQHLYGNQEDFLYGMGEPLNVVSNVSNGYGLFAGFNADMVSLRIEEQVIERK